MKLKLPFGIKSGRLVDVGQVEPGIKCNCTCAVCGHKLVARKGTRKVHHFAHYKAEECVGSLETALHKAAKEILERNKYLKIPEVSTGLITRDIQLYPEQTIYFDRVYLEKRFNNITPDLIIESNGKQLIIEIAVTHFIDKEKVMKISDLNISTLEINLSNIDRQITLAFLEKILVEETENKKWIYNSKENNFKKKIHALGKELMVIDQGLHGRVKNCPLIKDSWRLKKAASLLDDCFDCDFYIDARGDEFRSHAFITCVGHEREKMEELIKTHLK